MKTLKQPKTLTIDCERWARGGKGGDSRLLNRRGKMCCLGFDALACGADRKMIRNICNPEQLALTQIHLSRLVRIREQFMPRNTKICEKMIFVNDDDSTTDTDRMTKLRALFAKIGVRVRFINKPKV